MEEIRPLDFEVNRRVYAGSFPASKGHEKIYFRCSKPKEIKPEQTKIHLVILHGAVEYHRRHLSLPEFLFKQNEKNVIVTWMDLKGHGLSSGSRSHIDSFNEFYQDLNTLLKVVVDEPQWKTVLLGHSLGGLVVLKYFLSDLKKINSLSGIILSNPCLMPKVSNELIDRFMQRDLPEVMRKIRLPSPLNGHDLTRDAYYAAQFQTDPLIAPYMTLGLVSEILKAATQVKRSAYYLDCPVLFLLSGADKIVSLEETLIFSKGIADQYKTVKIYDDSYHEILNDNDRELVFEDVKRWLCELA